MELIATVIWNIADGEHSRFTLFVTSNSRSFYSSLRHLLLWKVNTFTLSTSKFLFAILLHNDGHWPHQTLGEIKYILSPLSFPFSGFGKAVRKNDRCHKAAPQSTTKSQVQNFDVGGPIHGRPKLLTMWKVATKFRLKISHFVLYSLIISLNDYVVFSQQIQAITHTIHTSLFLIGDPHQSVFITTKNDVIKISVIS